MSVHMGWTECHHRAQQSGSWHRCHRCPSVLGVDSRTSCFHLSRRLRALLWFTLSADLVTFMFQSKSETLLGDKRVSDVITRAHDTIRQLWSDQALLVHRYLQLWHTWSHGNKNMMDAVVKTLIQVSVSEPVITWQLYSSHVTEVCRHEELIQVHACGKGARTSAKMPVCRRRRQKRSEWSKPCSAAQKENESTAEKQHGNIRKAKKAILGSY